MTVYTDLNVIDDFEQRHGFDETLKRSRAFMISYFELMRTALPEPVRHGLEVAKRYSEGALAPEDSEGAGTALWKYLKERHASADYKTPENAIVHAAFALLTEHKDLKPGETISERVSSFLDCANRFEDHSDSVASLLKSMYKVSP
jgi:hypothetical protein